MNVMVNKIIKFTLVILFIAFSINLTFGKNNGKYLTDDTLQRLEEIETFAIGPVGFAAQTSEGEKLAREILSKSNASDEFQKLLQSDSPAAKMYALWGLRKIHGRESEKFFEVFRNSTEKVGTMSGCLMSQRAISEVVKEIESPYYLELTAKTLWTMNLEQRKKLLTNEEEKMLLKLFRQHKAAGTLDTIADVPFGKLLESEYKN